MIARGTNVEDVDPTTTAEGSPAWALEQLRAGKRVRKSTWAKGHVRLEGEHLIVLDGDGRDTRVPRSFLEEDIGAWLWEIDGPRRFIFSSATRVDLAMLPGDISIGQLIAAIERCQGTDRNYDALVRSAWAAMGQPAVGDALMDFAATQEGYLLLQAARQGHDRDATRHAMQVIDAIRKGAGR